MRGSPITQVLILLAMLLLLGIFGRNYVQINSQNLSNMEKTPLNPESANIETVEAEIELTFSSTPISYELRKITSENDAETKVLQSSAEIENPSYHDAQIRSHSVTTYLLDIVWKDEPSDDSRHFVQISISPSYGVQSTLSFSTHSETMNETFDYSTTEQDH